MGAYVYKVTAKTKTLADGTKANIAVFAYKPYYGWDSDEANARLRKKSACAQAERFVRMKGKNWTGRVVISSFGEVAVAVNEGTFTDDWFDSQVNKMR
jgi:hypothetical protein